MKPPEIVDYPSRAKWRVLTEDAAAAKFRVNGAVRDSDRRITVYLEDEDAKKTPVVARMDVKTAEKLLCDLKEKGPGATESPISTPGASPLESLK
jgi:hypothetical protein